MKSNDISDFYSDSSYWMQGLSNIATDNGKNTNFSKNWSKYDFKNYNLLNINSLMSKDLAQLNQLISSGNSSVAIMFFSNGLGQEMLNQSSDLMNEDSDQNQDLANLVDAIAQLKQWFQEAASQTAGSSTDQQLTSEFIQGLTAGKYSIENFMKNIQNWLENVYKSSEEAINNMNSLVDSSTNPTSLAKIWSEAGVNSSVSPSAVESQNLQTMLSGFDTLDSSATTLSNQFQSKIQYQSNYFSELTSFMSNLNNGISNASNVVNNNITNN